MSNFEILALDPTTPQIRAPGAGDGYSVPRDMTFATGTTLNAPTTVVSVNTSTDALRITQVGSGNALLVEDSANPDATPTVITATGNVGIGTTAPVNVLDLGSGTSGRGIAWGGLTGTGNYNNIWGSQGGARLTLATMLRGSTSVANGYESSNAGNFAKSALEIDYGVIKFFTNTASAVPIGDAYTPTERMRITSAGNVGIGTSSPNAKTEIATIDSTVYSTSAGQGENGSLLVTNQLNNNNNISQITFRQRNVSTYDTSIGASGGSSSFLFFKNNGAERMRITSAGEVLVGKTSATANGGDLQVSSGITFPATQVAKSDANTLDDYEEGTFTPTIDGSTSAGTGTYVSRAARYTKVGRLVSIQVFMSWSAHTGTGDMRLAGLPFTSETGTNSAAAIGYAHNIALTANNVITAYTQGNSTYINVYQYPVGGGASTAVPIDTAGEIVYSATYVTTT